MSSQLTINSKFLDDSEYKLTEVIKPDCDLIQEMNEHLRRIHLLITEPWESLEDLIQSHLKAGCEIFGLETGIVSKIEKEEYMILGLQTVLKDLNQGDTFDLEDTYCQDVVQYKCVLGYPNIGNMARFKSHPVYQTMKLESYLSAPIYIDGKIYGTINFTSRKVRKHGFVEHERDLMQILAGSIANFLRLREKEIKLNATNDRLKRLVGYVAHDLRSPLVSLKTLNNALSTCDLDKEEWKTYLGMYESITTKGLNLVQDVLYMAALGNGKLDLNVEKLPLKPVLNQCLENLDFLKKDKHVELNIDHSYELEFDPKRLEQVFNNLLNNAFQYSKKNSTIRCYIQENSSKTYIILENEINDSYVDHVQNEYLNSTGYGLEIVYEIIDLHGWEFDVDQNENQFKVIITIK